MVFNQLPKFLQPRLRLFLSADLVGSTRLKQAATINRDGATARKLADLAAIWFDDMADFYRGFEIEFARTWSDYEANRAPSIKWAAGKPPELWKINGDELIYVKELEDSRQCVIAVHCWLRAVRAYQKRLQSRGKNLGLKATGWLAGFPVSNAEVIFAKAANASVVASDVGSPIIHHYSLLDEWYRKPHIRKNYIRDYVGPFIDLGFRLSQRSSDQKFMISIDLAYVLTVVAVRPELSDDLTIKYDGRQQLKGILRDEPYPLFWIDTGCRDAIGAAEDSIQRVPAEDVRKVCEAFYLEYKETLFRPFIISNTEQAINRAPDSYSKLLKKICQKWKSESDKLAYESNMKAEYQRKFSSTSKRPKANKIDKFVKSIKKA